MKTTNINSTSPPLGRTKKAGSVERPSPILTGTGGILFMFLGGWLAIRAFRLQKYGDPTFSGSNIKARERAQERRRNRGVRTKSPTTGSASGTARATPAPSKRYTPKKTNRR